MSNFLQFTARRRQTKGGLFDTLIEQYGSYQSDPDNIGDRLKDQIRDWLIADKKLSLIPNDAQLLKPQAIGDTLANRVCDIAGHVWLEFTDEDAIRGTKYADERDLINAHLAEFIPDLDPDDILAAFDARSGGPISWTSVTEKKLLDLLAPLLRESTVARKPVEDDPRPASGVLPGYMNLLTPDDLRRQADSWFEDRKTAHITPFWQIDDPDEIIDAIKDLEAGERYSFTPEQYQKTDNCVTWALRALDSLSQGDSLDLVRNRCGITELQCGHKTPLDHKPCEDLHIRTQGRMKCVVNYASEADKQRQGGVRAF